MNGMFISGLYVGGSSVKKDGKVSYNYLISDGSSQTWRIKCDEDLLETLKFGDFCTFKVRVNAFNGNVYFSGVPTEYPGF